MSTVTIRAAATYAAIYLIWTVLFPIVSDLGLIILTAVACVGYVAVAAYVWLMTSAPPTRMPSAVRAAIERKKG